MSRLVLLRHGESTANAEDSFAGWLDVPLTPRGFAQAQAAGRGLAALRPDAVHTSVLGRAIATAGLMTAAGRWDVPLRADWRLNERHYGALQGLGRAQARRRYGAAVVESWRRSVDVAPPPASAEQLAVQLADHRYAQNPRARLIVTESLGDVARRMAPYWQEVLQPELTAGRTVVVVSHGNAVRVLVHLASGVPLEEAAQLQVPTAMPIMPPALVLTDSPPVP
jgi:2,3-bisphosphoglycerate-dependent phosphoglycerate mutase